MGSAVFVGLSDREEKQGFPYGIVLIVSLGHFLVDFMVGITPVYKTIAHLDIGKIGAILAVCVLIGEGMQWFFGSLGDLGYRKLLMLGGVVAAVCNAFLAYTQSYLLLFFLLLVTCLGSGAFHPSAMGALSHLQTKHRSLFVTLFVASGALGMGISQLIFSKVYFLLAGKTMILSLPILCLVGLAIFYPFGEAAGVNRKKEAVVSSSFSFLRFFREKPLALLFLSQVCNQTLFWGLVFMLPDFLLVRGYDTWISFGGGHLCLIFGAASLMIPAGLLADRYSSKFVVVGGTLCGMVMFYTLLLKGLSPVLLLSLLFGLGAMLGAVNAVSLAMGNRLMPSDPGKVSAFLMGTVWCIAEGLGPAGTGMLAKMFVADAPAKALGCLGILFLVKTAVVSRLFREVEGVSPAG